MSKIIQLNPAVEKPEDKDVALRRELATNLYKLQRLTMAQAHIAGLLGIDVTREALESIAVMITDQHDEVVASLIDDEDDE